MNRTKYKVLVVSNEAFSKTSSNGRTLMNLLKDVPQDQMAQFYIHGTPEQDFCLNNFQVSDQDALQAFLHRGKHKTASEQVLKRDKPSRPQRSLRNLVLREIVWGSFCWWTPEFSQFLEGYSPNIVLLQAGDAPFMYAIARKIAVKFQAKLVMYNSESYVLKKRIYAGVQNHSLWHFILMSTLKWQYKKFMENVAYCIYNMEALEASYQLKYPHKGKSCTMYTSSEIRKLRDNSGDNFHLLYCGNLGVGRDKPLDEIARVLKEVDPSATIEIYGKFPSQESQEMVCKNSNVNYHGFVDYSAIPDLMSRASMLVHCENNERVDNSRYAFSTKIADCISSTRPLLVYATKDYPFVVYLEKNQCAHIAADYATLKTLLQQCITDRSFRDKYAENAEKIALKNHNLQNNSKRICEIFTILAQQRRSDELG